MFAIFRRLYRSSRFAVLFNFHDEKAFGRSVMLASSTIGNVISWLTGSLFYTSFLMMNGIDLVNIGIISFVPYIANCFSIFCPSILERFPRRKWILAAGRAGYYVLNLLAITVMPMLVHDQSAKIIWFVILTFSANIVSALFVGGYSVWHLKFIPNEIRAEYFATNSMVANFIGCGAALASGLIADALAASPYKDTIVILFRYIAFALGMLEVWAFTRPVEYPYEKSSNKPRLKDIITKPFSHRKFILTMLIVFLWTFFANVPAGALNYYLIENVGVQYTFIYVINMCYPFFLLFLMPFWNRLLKKWGWFKTFAFTAIAHFPTTLMYSCVTAETYLWMLPTLRLIQHFLGVGMNTAYSNLTFINMPSTDQTNYISFHTVSSNGSAFLGMLCGTTFINSFPDIMMMIGGMEFVNVQMLLWVQAFGQLAVPLLLLAILPRIQPDAAELR